jgi:hypothetical protein
LGTNAVLIVDEAQGLPVHVLEEIRLLLNQEMAGERLLQIVLCGQPELEERLKRPDLRQIRQRISLRCQTVPLSREETHSYIQKRLYIAGSTSGTIFLPGTIDAVHFYARGIPRVMNLLCEHALIRAYMKQMHTVPADIVDEVARQFQFDDIRPVTGPINVTAVARPVQAEFEPLEPETPATPAGAAVMSNFVAVISQDHAGMPPNNEVDTRRSVAASALYGPNVGSPEPPPGRFPYLEAERLRETGEVPAFIEAERTGDLERPLLHKEDARRHVADIVKRSAAAGKAIAGSISFSFLSGWFRKLPQKLSSIVNSPRWESHTTALLRWLQQPMPTVKIHRRTNH